MSSAAKELQRAIYLKLNGDATLSALITGVFDHVPQNQAFPYVVLGEDTLKDWSTFGTLGQEPTVTLHVWSRSRGKREAQDILSRIDTLLHRASLTVTGQNVTGIEREFEQTLRDGDGVTYHGVQRYRVLLHE